VKLRALLIAPALLLIAACGGGTESSDVASPSQEVPASTTVVRTTSAAPTPTAAVPPKSVRGHLIKELGEPAGIRGPGGSAAIEFTLTDLQLVADCGSDGTYPNENGLFAILSFDVSTGVGVDTSQFGDMFNPNAFAAVTAEDRTVTNVATTATYACAAADLEVPDRFAPGSNYSGNVVLDVPANTTAITFMHDDASGWEWSVP